MVAGAEDMTELSRQLMDQELQALVEIHGRMDVTLSVRVTLIYT